MTGLRLTDGKDKNMNVIRSLILVLIMVSLGFSPVFAQKTADEARCNKP